jgi:hypothetical protein
MRHFAKYSNLLNTNGGSEWESNPPATGNLPPAGFEDRGSHRTACASIHYLSIVYGNTLLRYCIITAHRYSTHAELGTTWSRIQKVHII